MSRGRSAAEGRPAERPTAEGAIELVRPLRAKMLPLAVLLAATITLAAPLSFTIIGLHGLRAEAVTIAHRVATLVEREVHEDESLWQYNLPKLLEHSRLYQSHPHVVGIELADAEGRSIDLSPAKLAAYRGDDTLLWADAAIGGEGRELGAVWVAVSTTGVYEGALLVLVLFALVGAAFAAAIYVLPTRTAERAQQLIAQLIERLQRSSAQLASLNVGLEQRVSERSQELAAAYRELQDLSTQAVMLQERDRRAIARELHDAVGQALTAVRLNLQLLQDGAHQDKRALVAQTVQLIDHAIEEVRRAVVFLGPAILDEIGLAAALERLCDDVAERAGLTVSVTIEGPVDELPPAVESTCYRVVQEGLNNVVKHAAAARAAVDLAVSDETVRLTLGDDGRGMAEPGGAGRGLAGIRERITILGGTVTVQSAPGEGTTLAVTVPRSTKMAQQEEEP